MVMPSKRRLAKVMEVVNKGDCKEWRKSDVSTGTLLMSRIIFIPKSLLRGITEDRLKTEIYGSVMM